MSSSERQINETLFGEHSDDDDDGCQKTRIPSLLLHSPSSQQEFSTTIADDDSRLSSSIRTGHHATSLSSDSDSSEMEEKGAFNYFPSHNKKRESVKITNTYNPPYDEAILVEHSDKSSVESPRSDASSAREYDVTQLESDDLSGRFDREMTTFRDERHCFLENDSDSDDNMHQRQYGRQNDTWESLERPRASSTSSLNLISTLRSSSSKKAPSDGVHFSILGSTPPIPVDTKLLRHVGPTVERAMSSSYSFSQASFSPVHGDSSDIKKKKKKKKDGRDESSKEGTKPGLMNDVNGNPLHQMRGLSRESHEGTKLFPPGRICTYGTTNQHDFPIGGTDAHHSMARSDESTSHQSGSSGTGKDRKSKRTRKPEVTQKSEDDPNYVGDIKDVNHLVKYITSANFSQKQLKKLSANEAGGGATNAAVLSADSKAQKKGKDRNKTKYSQTPSSGESLESSVISVENLSVTPPGAEQNASFLCHSSGGVGSVSDEDSVDSKIVNSEEQAENMGNSAAAEKPASDDIDVENFNLATTEEHSVYNLVTNHHSSKKLHSYSSVKSSNEDAVNLEKNHKNHELKTSKKKLEIKDSKDKPENQDHVNNKPLVQDSADNNNSKKPKIKGPRLEKSESVCAVADAGTEIAQTNVPKSETQKLSKELERTSNKLSKKSLVLPSAAGQNKSPSSFEQAVHSKEDIFTDVDIPRYVEQEFIVVSGKKKKKLPLPASSQGYVHSHYHAGDIQHSSFHSFGPHHRGGARDFHNRPQQSNPKVRSFTPPPFALSGGAEPVEKTRDLSPSAFPVLRKNAKISTKVNPLGNEGRRRSLEELTSDTGQLLSYDSDRESVKSLPAAKGVGSASLNYPISYATMVATPRPSADSSKAESVSSGTEGGGSSEWASPSAIWKGSLHERRHSIGSSPEDCAKLSTSTADLQTSRPKSGSQELLPRDKLNDSVGIILSDFKGIVQSESACSFIDAASTLSDVDSARGGSEAGSESAGDVFVPPASLASPNLVVVAPDSKPSKVSKMNHTIASHETARTEAGHNNPQNVATACVVSSVNDGKSLIRSHATVLQDVDLDIKSGTVPATKSVNHLQKSRISAPVTFYDKRQPVSVDVSFGFDAHLEASQSNKAVEAQTEAIDLYSAPVTASVGSSDVVDDTVDEKSSSVTLHQNDSQSAASIIPQVSNCANKNSNGSSKPAKGPHISGLNGLVALSTKSGHHVTETIAGNSGAVAADASDSVKEPSPTVVLPSLLLSDCKSKAVSDDGEVEACPKAALEGRLTFTFGDELGLPQEGESTGKKARIASFCAPKNQPAAFNIADAVSFLQKEWNKVQKSMEKDPQSVEVYKSPSSSIKYAPASQEE